MGMHNKGKTTLLKHLRAVGRYQDSFFSNLRAIPQGNASIGVKIGTWSYYKDRSGSADQYREILFYTWDYAGEVYSRNNIYCAVIVLLLHRWSTTPLINYSFTLVLSTLWCGKCQMALMECTAFYHGCKKYMYVVIIMYYTNILWLQAKAPKSQVIIVGTHLDWIESPDREARTREYEDIIRRCFTDEHCEDLPNCWPKIASIHFVGLLQGKGLDLNIKELREDIYNIALNLKVPYGMCAYRVVLVMDTNL